MNGTDIILVTGANSGLGRGIVETLATQGHRIFAAMRDVGGRNAAIAEDFARRGIEAVEIDVTSGASVATGVARVMDVAGRIDVLVNCAGVMWTGVTEAFSPRQFQTILETNLVGPYRLMKAVLPHMRQRNKGLLLTITSLAGKSIIPGAGHYCASKAGLEALAETIGYEVAPFGIESIIVEPGPFATNLKNAAQPPEDRQTVSAYGAHGDFDGRIYAAVGPMVESGKISVEPQLVADHVARLIALPSGRRPRRTTVGWDLGMASINDRIADYQSAFLRQLGMEDLEVVRQ